MAYFVSCLAFLSLLLACFSGCSDGESGAPSGSGGSGASDAAIDTGPGGSGAKDAGADTAADTGAAGAPDDGGVHCGAALPAGTLIDPASAAELAVEGDPGAALGIFDPSLAYPAGQTSGAMAYSAVPSQDGVHTRVAVSSDAGATWTYSAAVNAARDVTTTVPATSARCPAGTCSGKLIHEVPSLVDDLGDADASRRYKIFVHSYLVLPGDVLARDLGYIGLFTAPNPAGPWADEGKVIGWQGESELSSAGAATVATSFAQLSNCAAFTEPSALVSSGGLVDLALGCAAVVNGTVEIRIELLRSFDSAKTFSYAGRLLAASEARCLGGARPEFNAPQLFVQQGTTYLIASPAGPTSAGFDGYRGCYVFEVQLATAGVKRDAVGNPLVRRILDAPDNRFTGACSYAQGASAHGYLVSELMADAPPRIFRIFESGVTAP